MRQSLQSAFALVCLVSLSACASSSKPISPELGQALKEGETQADTQASFWARFKIEPWVKPYERSNLADPIMAVGRNPIALSYAKHVHESREGARGADGSAGGGCGCN
ncbi:DUF4266 domain-containing protein [Agaribacter flavus]|uniref:DUF4266 domain-containing protein n=1 Tax=Agaribacter flavus TaxID=1902781 RepID=A0ABV7FQN6_9ALTE